MCGVWQHHETSAVSDGGRTRTHIVRANVEDLDCIPAMRLSRLWPGSNDTLPSGDHPPYIELTQGAEDHFSESFCVVCRRATDGESLSEIDLQWLRWKHEGRAIPLEVHQLPPLVQELMRTGEWQSLPETSIRNAVFLSETSGTVRISR